MVRKLMKHELYALFRVILWISLAVILFAAISRLLLAHSILQSASDTAVNGNALVIAIFLIAFYVLSICALIVAAWAISVSRFYKSLFTGEGYMTLALPVTADQIIWAKLLSAIVAMFYAAVVSFGSLFILFAGTVGDFIGIGGVIEALADLFSEFTGLDVLTLIERILTAIFAVPMSLLVLYAGMSLGQFFTARRTLMIFLIFAGVYVLSQMFSVLAVMPFGDFLFLTVGAGAEHILAWIRIVFYAAVDVGCFFLVRYILRNKVNLIA